MTNDSLKAKVEAALFLTEKPLRADAIARIVNADSDIVRQTIIELIHDYEAREGGLEIADDGGYIVQVKDQYTTLIDEFVPIDMPTALIRTLSAIAIKQPVMQSEIIKLRGAGAYDHIKELIIRELVNKREEGGRSPLLTTTKKFQDYFKLSKDGKSLRSFLSDAVKPGSDAGEDLEGTESQTEVPVTVGDTTVVAAVEVATETKVEETVEAPVETKVELPIDTTIGILDESEEKTFDMSPEPGTPSIGVPGSSEKRTAEARSEDRQEGSEETITIAEETVETIVAESASLELAE
jgi:segregation and condensation protein B